MPLTIIGNPENRRVTMFQAALAAQGHAPARVIAWRDLAERPGEVAELLADVASEAAIVRIDSAGEDDAVERAFLRRGEPLARELGFDAIDAATLAAMPYELGRIVHPRQAHLGFMHTVAEIGAALGVPPVGGATADTSGASSTRNDATSEHARSVASSARGGAALPHLRVLPPPSAIDLLFDKTACSTAWHAAGIPVPEALPPTRDPDELRALMRERAWPSVFVKLTCGSSASCLAMFTHTATGEHAITTVEDTGHARFNTRKLQRLTKRAQIDRTLGFILREGALVERTIPKAKLDGRFFDLRVLAIDGEAAFVVARTSPHPITNLHLGGLRGDVGALRARVPPDAWDAAMASCVAVQQASGAFLVGVDLMFEPGLTAHRVIEGNAFGDLLPNLERDGLDVYGWQVAKLLGKVRA